MPKKIKALLELSKEGSKHKAGANNPAASLFSHTRHQVSSYSWDYLPSNVKLVWL